MTSPGFHRVKLLTPPGAGAIAVLRLSGSDPWGFIRDCFRLRGGATLSSIPSDGLILGSICDGEEIIDQVVVSSEDHAQHGMAENDTIRPLRG
jgi:tRNA U34 5-carboxymethylaminomethyl modifying GTPase MnmE/TrmE